MDLQMLKHKQLLRPVRDIHHGLLGRGNKQKKRGRAPRTLDLIIFFLLHTLFTPLAFLGTRHAYSFVLWQLFSFLLLSFSCASVVYAFISIIVINSIIFLSIIIFPPLDFLVDRLVTGVGVN
jgi:hypothetical protein